MMEEQQLGHTVWFYRLEEELGGGAVPPENQEGALCLHTSLFLHRSDVRSHIKALLLLIKHKQVKH